MKNALITGVLLLLGLFVGAYRVKGQKSEASAAPSSPSDIAIDSNAQHMLARGKQTFRGFRFGWRDGVVSGQRDSSEIARRNLFGNLAVFRWRWSAVNCARSGLIHPLKKRRSRSITVRTKRAAMLWKQHNLLALQQSLPVPRWADPNRGW